jgi:hypothetical protein
MTEKTTITMANSNWEVLRELLTAAEENWTPEDDGLTRDEYEALSWYIGERLKGHFDV